MSPEKQKLSEQNCKRADSFVLSPDLQLHVTTRPFVSFSLYYLNMI